MLRLVTTAGALLVALAAAVWLVPSDKYIFLPDEAHAVAPVVRVEGERRGDDDRGGIFYVDVLVRKATIIEYFFPSIRDGSTLVPPELVRPPGVDDATRRQIDLRQMATSQDKAAAVALRTLGYDVVATPRGALVTAVIDDAPAVGKLKPSDVIVGIDGRAVRTLTDMRRALERRSPGDVVRLRVRDGKRLREVSIRTVADPADSGRAVIGIIIQQSANVRLPLDVDINTGQVGGPSAGLAFALDIVEELGRDVDRGYRVAATGEIELDGTVGPIGGVKQKTIGARQSGIDVLLVPAGDNAREARRYAGGLRVIAVYNFRQALRALATLPLKR